jgi:hypothetical protein
MKYLNLLVFCVNNRCTMVHFISINRVTILYTNEDDNKNYLCRPDSSKLVWYIFFLVSLEDWSLFTSSPRRAVYDSDSKKGLWVILESFPAKMAKNSVSKIDFIPLLQLKLYKVDLMTCNVSGSINLPPGLPLLASLYQVYIGHLASQRISG